MYIYLFPEIRRQQINEKEHSARTGTMRIQTNNLDLLKPINALPLLLRSLALVCFVFARFAGRRDQKQCAGRAAKNACANEEARKARGTLISHAPLLGQQ